MNAYFATLPPEGCPHGLAVVRKNSISIRRADSALFLDDCTGVVATYLEERDALH